MTYRGVLKKMALKEIESGTRAKQGIVTLRELKTNPHKMFAVILTNYNGCQVLTQFEPWFLSYKTSF
ncbi:hypothetical protein [Psychrobacillus soli]|uniref:Uncharacterized protein n=1 Tax=Psychrobacillus soli TaxID=1543965 RepID=A0A544TLY4_9BACI|nr:hypothetical protein [Psychrobacillus soli]TQR18456.1 hypothetical protein FG383_00965 [Psychrobacillus soli]